MNPTWLQIEVMQRSHKWDVERTYPPSHFCRSCRDTLSSPARVCPRVTASDLGDALFDWPEVKVEVPA